MSNAIIALTITIVRDYVKYDYDASGNRLEDTGRPVFVYAVDGTRANLDAYADAQGSSHRVDEATGKDLWFTGKYCGETGTLLVNTDKGTMYPDMSAFRRQASLAAQFGGNLGNQIAQTALGKLFRVNDTEPAKPAHKQ